jgi:3-keto-5-aminohexanoate cleavage enzyme
LLEFLIAEAADILPDATWAAAGIGRHQFEVNQWCLELGGHCRTGLEDNIKTAPDRLAASNAELVRKIVDIASEYNRYPASPIEARKILRM